MSDVTLKPVAEASAARHGDVEVGEDLGFQRKWWRFERIAWAVFTVFIVLDIAGASGRGALAKARRHTADGALTVEYERIERSGAPATLTMTFGPSAIQRGEVRVFVTDSLVRELGGQRVIPQPQTTVIGDGGLTYTFPAGQIPARIAFSLAAPAPGFFTLGVKVLGSERLDLPIAVLP